jgi:hypothetical protein
MGLMDKVKAQASELAQQGKAKYDEAQATRRANALLRNLGAVVYADRTGRGSGDTQAQIEKLVADLKAHEAASGINLAPEPTDQPGPSGPGQPGPSGAGQPGPSGPGQQQGGPGNGSTNFPPEAGSTTQV